jgi:hypothetical protein
MMEPGLLLGFGCTAGSGKDTAFKCCRDAGLPVVRASMGDVLRRQLGSLLDAHGIDVWSEDRSIKEVVRPLLVDWARLLHVRHGETYLFIEALAACQGEMRAEGIVVFTDIRFPFDAAELQRRGGYYIHLETNRAPVNDWEKSCEPVLRKMADRIVKNDFDPGFHARVLETIACLREDFDRRER